MINEGLLIFGMFLVTFGVRYPVLALVSRITLPELVTRALKFVPTAVLSAIIFPAVLYPDGETLSIGLENAALFASIVAVFISWRTKNLLLTILAGMLSLWAWQFLASLLLPF